MLTYNRANYIRAAIDSALSQTYSNFELVILDDGSTDATAAVVGTYTDPRITYLQDPVNKGLYRKRAESLGHVRGYYVAILDSDDFWTDPTKLEKQVAFMEKNQQCAVVGTFITLINDTGHETGKDSYLTEDKSIRRTLLWRNQFANSSVLMRHSLLLKTNGYQEVAPCEDLELFLQLGHYGTFANLPLYALAYRIHPGGESARKMKLARQILRVITRHRHQYPGAVLAYLKYCLFYLLARFRLI